MKAAILLLALSLAAPAAHASWWANIFVPGWAPCPQAVELETGAIDCIYVIDGRETVFGPVPRPLEAKALVVDDGETCEYQPFQDVEPGSYVVFAVRDGVEVWARSLCVAPHVSPGQDLTIRIRRHPEVFADAFEAGDFSAWEVRTE